MNFPDTITIEMLEEQYACNHALEQFTKTFGSQAALTRANLLKAVEIDLDLLWFVRTFFADVADDRYQSAIARARRDFENAADEALRAHEKATRQLHQQLQADLDAARAAYLAAEGPEVRNDSTHVSTSAAFEIYVAACNDARRTYQQELDSISTKQDELASTAYRSFMLAVATALADLVESR